MKLNFTRAEMTAQLARANAAVAAEYRQGRGWSLTPTAYKDYAPLSWEYTPTEGDLAASFEKPHVNFGVVTGDPSGGLVGIVVASDEAKILARSILPPTTIVHGARPDGPVYLYVATGFAKQVAVNWSDWNDLALVDALADDDILLLPPSVNEDGGPVYFAPGARCITCSQQ